MLSSLLQRDHAQKQTFIERRLDILQFLLLILVIIKKDLLMSIKKLTPSKSDKQTQSYRELQKYYKDNFSHSPSAKDLSKSHQIFHNKQSRASINTKQYQTNLSLKISQSKPKSQRKQKKQYSQKQIIEKLQKHRQKLTKTLQTHTLVYNLEHINKCLQHGCYISAYDINAKKLLCAGCFTQVKTQKKNGDKVKQKISPLQKSEGYLQSDIIFLKSQIQNEVYTLEQIQNILYQGCNEQKNQMASSLKMIDEAFQKLIHSLRQTQKILKDTLQTKYKQQKIKHQIIVKQLGLLKSLAKEFIGRQQEFPKKQKLKPNQYYIASKVNSYLQNTTQIQSHLRANFPYKRQLYQELAYRHLVYKQLSEGLKFNKSGYAWSKQKHINIVKMVSQKVFKGIQRLSSLKLQKIGQDCL